MVQGFQNVLNRTIKHGKLRSPKCRQSSQTKLGLAPSSVSVTLRLKTSPLINQCLLKTT